MKNHWSKAAEQICPSCKQIKSACKGTDNCFKAAGVTKEAQKFQPGEDVWAEFLDGTDLFGNVVRVQEKDGQYYYHVKGKYDEVPMVPEMLITKSGNQYDRQSGH